MSGETFAAGAPPFRRRTDRLTGAAMLLPALLFAAAPSFSSRPADLVPPGQEAAYVQQLNGAIAALARSRNDGHCPPGSTATGLGVRRMGRADVLLHVDANAPVAPDATVYEEHVHIEGCGPASRADNIMTVRQKDGSWLMQAFIPGDSHVTPQLLHDVLPKAVALATAGRPAGQACANGKPAFQILDTLVVGDGPKPGGPPGQTWRERWVQAACGDDRTVTIDFVSTADGGTSYDVKPAWSAPAPAR